MHEKPAGGYIADIMTGLRTYQVRESQRARRIRLEVSSRDGLLVIVPRGTGRRHVTSLLEEKHDWIERAFRRVRERAAQHAARPRVELPERLSLCAVDEEWTIEYRPAEGARRVAIAESAANRLVAHCDVAQPWICRALLRHWLNRKAHRCLIPWLERVSCEIGFVFAGVRIRAQRTRWGSCSRRGRISLNERLLFLPAPLVEYVLHHELCHTVHLNHGPAFWELLKNRLPECRRRQKELRDAWRWVPDWVERE